MNSATWQVHECMVVYCVYTLGNSVFSQLFYLTYFLANTLAFYLAKILAFYLTYLLRIFLP